MEVALTARYWTKVFVVFTVLSYLMAYLFMLVYMWAITSFSMYDPAQYGVIYQICLSPSFWCLQVRTAPPLRPHPLAMPNTAAGLTGGIR